MASFRSNGVDAIEASFQQLASLSEEETYSILEAGAAVLVRGMQETLEKLGAVASGALRDSIRAVRKRGKDGVLVRIGPTGKRPKAFTGKRKKKDGKSHGSYQGTNAEVAYFLEYGSPRMGARHWMETALEQYGEEANAAMAAKWEEVLQSKGV